VRGVWGSETNDQSVGLTLHAKSLLCRALVYRWFLGESFGSVRRQWTGPIFCCGQFCSDSTQHRATDSASGDLGGKDGNPEEWQAQGLRAVRRALFEFDDFNKESGRPYHQPRNGGGVDDISRRYRRPIEADEMKGSIIPAR
jgi:hypothetical protein